jgi:NADH-quinone oxidoreductase subunit L
MLVPLILLGLLALGGGWIGIPQALGGGDQFAHFLEPVVNVAPSSEQVRVTVDDQGVRHATAVSTPEPARRVGIESQERMFSILSVIVALIGWFFADLFYRRKPGMADKLVERLRVVYALLVNKYWIDQVYNALIVTPLLVFSRYLLWGAVDRGVINGGIGGAAGGVRGLGALVQRVQSGNIRSYAGWLAIGAGALLLITYFGFSMHL